MWALEPDLYFEVTLSDKSSVLEGQWQLIGRRQGSGIAVSSSISALIFKLEPHFSSTVLKDVIDDKVGRRKVWIRLFGNVAMPEPEEDAVERSYGILNEYFPAGILTPEEVFQTLKRAKGKLLTP